eukprot:SAG11_NODE_3715_length_2263_cov_26.176525_2_plen_184_part_00
MARVKGDAASGGKVAQSAAHAQAAKLVALEAAAVGAARKEHSTWQAAYIYFLARERSRWRAAGLMVGSSEQAAAADEREAREAAVAWAAARKVVATRKVVVLNGAAAGLIAETVNGRHEVAVERELCGSGRWRWSWRGRGARGAETQRRRWEPCRRRERCRPWESRTARGDDGGSWRQFDPGG